MKSRGNAICTQLSPEEVFLCLCFRHVQGDLGTWQGLDMQLGDHGWGMSDLKSQILLVTGVKKKSVKKITDIARNWGIKITKTITDTASNWGENNTAHC